jgi:hypothetical protein
MPKIWQNQAGAIDRAPKSVSGVYANFGIPCRFFNPVLTSTKFVEAIGSPPDRCRLPEINSRYDVAIAPI